MSINRRDFMKLVGGVAGFSALKPFNKALPLPEFPKSERLGRIVEGKWALMALPNFQDAKVKDVYGDDVIAWNREVVGRRDTNYINQKWVETDSGYVNSSYVQPVFNKPNEPLANLPDGKSGFWAEVTVPYVDFVLENQAPSSPWIKNNMDIGLPTRLYYSQVMWVDQVKKSDVTGNMIYRINEKYGSYGDIFWAEAAAFRPLTAEEIAPISPDVDPVSKRVKVNLTYQTLSCFEEDREVYYCKISSGAKFDAFGNAVDSWATPVGDGHRTWRKSLSIHMAGGSATGGGYDTPGISWATFFSEGVAIHSTFWHNDYGVPRSHGCVNVTPEDSKWIFRWTTPTVTLDVDDITVGMPGGTQVDVIERTF
jgi:hypothetical protein